MKATAFLGVIGLMTAITESLPSPHPGLRESRSPRDRGLGFGKSKDKPSPRPKVTYPWDPIKPSENNNKSMTRPVVTQRMVELQVNSEEPFAEDYYDEYDFEFAKSGIKNDNFEKKVKTYHVNKINRRKSKKE